MTWERLTNIKRDEREFPIDFDIPNLLPATEPSLQRLAFHVHDDFYRATPHAYDRSPHRGVRHIQAEGKEGRAIVDWNNRLLWTVPCTNPVLTIVFPVWGGTLCGHPNDPLHTASKTTRLHDVCNKVAVHDGSYVKTSQPSVSLKKKMLRQAWESYGTS